MTNKTETNGRDTLWPSERAAGDEWADTAGDPGGETEGVWQTTIAVADQALEEANRIHRGVQQNLKLMQEVRGLRDELRRAQAELDRYRGMYARAVAGMRQIEGDSVSEQARVQSEYDLLHVRHRVHKLLGEHYAMTALRLDADTYTEHHERVLQHVLFQRRKGVDISAISAGDVAFLLL
jgi:hypothetical protein